ncbi:MAG: hypothetical protein K0Q72_3370 [Armatimonadetes bacterium]|jgi:hypothetical protein|nr:hypothetical protein [Armatimonadota bacterium]
MWTRGVFRGSAAEGPGESRRSELDNVQRIQQSLWYLLAVIAVAEMLFGAWAVGLIPR